MSTTMVSLRTAVGMVAGAAVLFFAGVYAAHAKPGGETANALSFAGTLTGVSGKQTLTFTFKKNGAAACSPAGIDVMVTPDPGTGNFQASIPLVTCPSSLFDGSDVFLDVSVGGMAVVTGQPVGPVPYAKYADKVGSPDCPVGYDRVGVGAPIVCMKGVDEIVKVGNGAAAFWIDRYEASVWSDPAGMATQYGAASDDYPGTFPDNGQVTDVANLVYAVSKKGVPPSAYMTWFQANLACLASGKRLPFGSEWLLAAKGTNDPGANNGANGACVTSAAGKRNTGAPNANIGCASVWGAQDMIGNVWEWTGEWYAGLGDGTGAFSDKSNWPNASYGGDGTWNIASNANTEVLWELTFLPPQIAVAPGSRGH